MTRAGSPAGRSTTPGTQWPRSSTTPSACSSSAKGQQILSDEVPALPISPVLDIIVYNSAKVIGVKVTPNGAFYNLSEWYCRTGKC